MKNYKISKLLKDSIISKFATRKCTEVNDLLGSQHSANKNIRFKTLMLRSYLFEYSGAYIVAKRTIDILAAAANEDDEAEKYVAFKNMAPYRSYISQINNTLI